MHVSRPSKAVTETQPMLSGDLKGLERCGATRLRCKRATLTSANVISDPKLVTLAMTDTLPNGSIAKETSKTSREAAYGVRAFALTLENALGRIPSAAIP